MTHYPHGVRRKAAREWRDAADCTVRFSVDSQFLPDDAHHQSGGIPCELLQADIAPGGDSVIDIRTMAPYDVAAPDPDDRERAYTVTSAIHNDADVHIGQDGDDILETLVYDDDAEMWRISRGGMRVWFRAPEQIGDDIVLYQGTRQEYRAGVIEDPPFSLDELQGQMAHVRREAEGR